MTSALKICPICSTEYPANERFCPRDGSALRALGGSATDLVGSIIAERYHVLKKLGEGGMGQVYLAEHVKMGRKSAVKVMNPGMVDNVDAISRFNREAANASRINHPNVAGIYDFGETADGLIYLAMEFVEGEPLTDIIKVNGVLPPHRASEIARQTAEGLSVAHDMGIVHRDLKPDNIMIGKGRGDSDLVKVVDFGIAKAAASDNQKVTKTGMVVGTPEYMSPEQLSGDPLDARSDIYSLGLVTFAMLTGKLPFPSDSMQETMIMRLTDKPKALSEMMPEMHWPDDVQAVMDKVLERDANRRYRLASEFARDLVEAIERIPKSTVATMRARASTSGASAAALTAATTAMGAIPKTQLSAKSEVPGRTGEASARMAAGGDAGLAIVAPPAATKSKVPIFVGAGVVVAAAVIGVVMMQGNGKTGATGPVLPPTSNTQPISKVPGPVGAPDGQTGSGTQFKNPVGATPSGGKAAATIDDQLYDISNRLMDETNGATQATYTKALQEILALKPRIKLVDDSVKADFLRATALFKLGNKDAACAIIGSVGPRATREKDRLGIAGLKSEAECTSSELL